MGKLNLQERTCGKTNQIPLGECFWFDICHKQFSARSTLTSRLLFTAVLQGDIVIMKVPWSLGAKQARGSFTVGPQQSAKTQETPALRKKKRKIEFQLVT